MSKPSTDRHTHAHAGARGHARSHSHQHAHQHLHEGDVPPPSVLQRGLAWRLAVVSCALAALALVIHASLAR